MPALYTTNEIRRFISKMDYAYGAIVFAVCKAESGNSLTELENAIDMLEWLIDSERSKINQPQNKLDNPDSIKIAESKTSPAKAEPTRAAEPSERSPWEPTEPILSSNQVIQDGGVYTRPQTTAKPPK